MALRWAHAHGCRLPEDACKLAIGASKLRTLQWLRSVDTPWGEHPLIHHPSDWPRLKREIVEVHKWAAQHGAPVHDGRQDLRPNLVAATSGHLGQPTYFADDDFGADGEEEMEEDEGFYGYGVNPHLGFYHA